MRPHILLDIEFFESRKIKPPALPPPPPAPFNPATMNLRATSCFCVPSRVSSCLLVPLRGSSCSASSCLFATLRTLFAFTWFSCFFMPLRACVFGTNRASLGTLCVFGGSACFQNLPHSTSPRGVAKRFALTSQCPRNKAFCPHLACHRFLLACLSAPLRVWGKCVFSTSVCGPYLFLAKAWLVMWDRYAVTVSG